MLHDHSAMGQWCRALNCTIPFTSEVETLYPALKNIKRVPSHYKIEIADNIRQNNSFPDTVVGFHGMDIFSTDWYLYAGEHAIKCVEKITGPCVYDDLLMVEMCCIESYCFRADIN